VISSRGTNQPQIFVSGFFYGARSMGRTPSPSALRSSKGKCSAYLASSMIGCTMNY
jgi:hypothetical protein